MQTWFLMLESQRLYFIHPSAKLLEKRLLGDFSGTKITNIGLVQITTAFAADILFLLPSWTEQLRTLTREPPVPGGVLVLKDGLLAVGTIGFKGQPDQDKNIEIGYGINATHWGHGLATEAVTALMHWAFNSNYATRVIAKTAVSNIASQRVMEKSNFVKTGESEYDLDEGELIFWEKSSP